MALRKILPKDPKHDFWSIIMCSLISHDPSVSDKDRSVFGMLAYRMLSKATEARRPDPVRYLAASSLSPTLIGIGDCRLGNRKLLNAAKVIHSPEELFLLVRVYLGSDHIREARNLVIESNDFGPHSQICNLDQALHRSLRLEVLQASEDWPALVDELRKAVKSPSTDDLQISKIISILIDAARQDQSSE
jgi:N-terminal acetyltransferase B complex non-catalytic subunit